VAEYSTRNSRAVAADEEGQPHQRAETALEGEPPVAQPRIARDVVAHLRPLAADHAPDQGLALGQVRARAEARDLEESASFARAGGGNDRLRLRRHQAHPGKAETAVVDGDAAGLVEERLPVADANDRRVDRAEHRGDPAQALDLLLLQRALGHVARDHDHARDLARVVADHVALRFEVAHAAVGQHPPVPGVAPRTRRHRRLEDLADRVAIVRMDLAE
jgi:hypothetical protein